MKVHKLRQQIAHLAVSTLAWRGWVLAIAIASTAFMLVGLVKHFDMDMSLESWFYDDDPSKIALDKFRSQFGSDDGIYVVVAAKGGDVFSVQSLQALQRLHQALSVAKNDPNNDQLQRITRIDDLISTRVQFTDDDGTLISQPLVGKRVIDASMAMAVKRLALSQPTFNKMFFSDDFRYAGIRLTTDFGTRLQPDDGITALDHDTLTFDLEEGVTHELSMAFPTPESDTEAWTGPDYADTQMDEYLNFMLALRAITEQDDFEHFDFYYTGNAPMMEFAMQSMEQASGLTLLMLVLVMGLLWLFFRSFSAVVWPVVLIAASAVWTLGAFSWLGITLSNMVSLTFMLVLAVGIADCVHVFSSYLNARQQGQAHRQAIETAYFQTGKAILLTTVTTMLGMLVLLTANIPQIGVFGVSSAVAVGMALVFTVLVLPVLMDIWPPVPKHVATDTHPHPMAKISAVTRWIQRQLQLVPSFVQRYTTSILMLYGVVFLLFIAGTSQVKVDSNFAELTREGSDIRVTYELVDRHMMGGQNLEVLLDFQQVDALKQPHNLRLIEAIADTLATRYPQYVITHFSLVDLVKDTHKVMTDNTDAHYTIPDDEILTAQLLSLFDNANPEDRRRLVSDDYSRTHISFGLKNAGSYEYTDFFDTSRADIAALVTAHQQQHPEATTPQWSVTGSLALMMELIDHMSWAQITSFTIAIGLISVLLIFTLGSWQAGLIAMIPNLLPAIFTFGCMGLLGIPLDTDTLIIAPLIIGIAVDDTIHFMSHYKDHWYESGDLDQALSHTIGEVGQAVVFTTLILGIGFFMLSFSDYLGLAKTGIFGSMAIFVALISDLLLLPAIIRWLKPDLGRRQYIASLTPAQETTS